MILVDTNVILRLVQPGHSMHDQAMAAVAEIRSREEVLSVVPQVLYEFWVVATRPLAPNGLGMTVAQANADIAKIVQRFRLIRDERAIFEPWRRLVTQYEVLGKNAHDARLVAAMQRHGIARILSFNADDFRRFPDIVAIDPAKGISSQAR
jgi:predicted nucleic acid-binding protein